MATDDRNVDAGQNADVGFTVEQATTPRTTQPVHVVVIEEPQLVDGAVLDALKNRMAALHAEHPRLDLLVDLGRVEFLSSPAIGLLGMLHRSLWKAKGRMKLCGIHPNVMQVFTVTRLAEILDIYGTREQALASF